MYRPTSSSSVRGQLPLKMRRAETTLRLAGIVAFSVSWSLLILVVELSGVCFLILPFSLDRKRVFLLFANVSHLVC